VFSKQSASVTAARDLKPKVAHTITLGSTKIIRKRYLHGRALERAQSPRRKAEIDRPGRKLPAANPPELFNSLQRMTFFRFTMYASATPDRVFVKGQSPDGTFMM
jgi:hypothetical protein